MAMIDSQKFYRDLANRSVVPLYFLFGDEPYLLNQCVERFKFAVLDETAVDFNYDLFYASDASVVAISDAVETLPMMAERRLVILKEAQELTDKEWVQLEPLLENPVSSTVFVILASRADKRKKPIRTLIESANCVEFKKPYENQIPSWINYIAENLGLKISKDAIHLLHKLVGSQLTEIEGELKKLGEFVEAQRPIEIVDVEQVVSRSKTENIFDFTKAIGENNRLKALELLVHLLDQGQHEMGLISLVARQIRMLLVIKKGMDEGLQGAQLAHYAQVPPYFLQNYTEQAKQWTFQKLEQTLVILAQTDRALKSSPVASHLWLENMVLKTCSSI